MIYVMSDIHGKYSMFKDMLEKIKFSDSDTMYILGDVVDRGEEPIKTLQYIIEQDNIELLLGNHEEFMLDFFKDGYTGLDLWFRNGGKITHEQMISLGEDDMEEVLSFVRGCPLIVRLVVNKKRFTLAHAGVMADNFGNVLQEQDRNFVLWSREEFYDMQKISNETVVFGHTPTMHLGFDTEPMIWHGFNMIGIDCGANFGYNLACLRLDDMEEFYVGKVDEDEVKR